MANKKIKKANKKTIKEPVKELEYAVVKGREKRMEDEWEELNELEKIDPQNPPEGYVILQEQSDGNWKGWMRKYGKVVEERMYEPHTVIDYLLHHP